MANCGKTLVVAWFVALGLLLATLLVAIFTFHAFPLQTVSVMGGATGVLLVVSVMYLFLVSVENSPVLEDVDTDSDDEAADYREVYDRV